MANPDINVVVTNPLNVAIPNPLPVSTAPSNWNYNSVAIETANASGGFTLRPWAQILADLQNLGGQGFDAVCEIDSSTGRGILMKKPV